MVDFINEVEEELRKDEYNRLLRRYGPFLLAIIVGIVAYTGFLEYQKYSKDKAARATSASYVAASDEAAAGNVDQSISDFLAIADKAPAGYAGLSLVRAASLKLEAGDSAEAIRLLDRAASTFDTPRHTQLAQIKAAYILANDGAYSDVINRLGPLMEKDAPYEFLARELMGFAALKSGDETLAREQFGYLESIPGVPATIKERAKQNLSLMRTADAAAAMQAPEPVAPETTPSETPPAQIETPNEN
ncbi:tetratricopeptide repeat protein [Hellea sp.]|nr:tetratricopeptide repeat protein [Hellea sp.]